MSAIGRMSVSALAGSGNIANRRRIEQAIENHMQLIHQADSLLTYDSIPDEHHQTQKLEDGTLISRSACNAPAEYLANALEKKGKVNNKYWTSDNGERPLFLFSSFPDPGKKS